MQNKTGILIYQTEDGNTKIDVRLENETVWMTQKAITTLYQKGVNTINEHIKNIYAERELQESATIRKNRIVQNDIIEKDEHRICLKPLFFHKQKRLKNFVIIRGGENNES